MDRAFFSRPWLTTRALLRILPALLGIGGAGPFQQADNQVVCYTRRWFVLPFAPQHQQ